MFKFIRTSSENTDFQELTKMLDAYLRMLDGEEHAFYAQFNKIALIKHAIVVYQDERAVACGAIKEYNANTMEIKRMYVLEDMRGKGLGTQILKELEEWAKLLNFPKCILETGNKQPDAIALYRKNGYQTIPNYGQYLHVENSVCFEKQLL